MVQIFHAFQPLRLVCAALLLLPGAAIAGERINIPHPPGCDIKGNIGKKHVKIYHLPGGKDYARTRINRKGERWFCTEEEARKAGWSKAKPYHGEARADPCDCIIPKDAPPGCPIKGNISYRNGRKVRIYHVPCSRSYCETVIRLEAGERWFCTEEEARKAGWRAPVR